jgi:mono/diheme cytochrome c family protein
MGDVLALSGFQKVGGLVVGLIIFIWFVFLGFQLFKSERAPGSEMTQAPNRKPYFDDEELETSRLDRYLGFALFFMALSAIALPLYYLNETHRQSNATVSISADSVHRGKALFTSFCTRCHSEGGTGGQAQTTVSSNPSVKGSPPKPVTWIAPPLNTVLRRYTPDAVSHIVTYGRQNTPMPPWGVAGGGALNQQSVQDIVAYLGSIQLPLSKTRAQTGEANVQGYAYPYNVAPGTNGELLFARYCSRCHTTGWSYGEPQTIGAGAFGPNLLAGTSVRQFPNEADQIDFVTNFGFKLGIPWSQNNIQYADPLNADLPYGVRGIGSISGGGMPAFGEMLTQEQIKAIVEYERNALGAQ